MLINMGSENGQLIELSKLILNGTFCEFTRRHLDDDPATGLDLGLDFGCIRGIANSF